MYAAFLAIATAGGLYFLLSHRRFDVFTLAFLSGGIYFLPAFVGSVRDPASDIPVTMEPGTYAVIAAVLAAITVGGWCFQQDGDAVDPVRVADRQATYISLLIAFGSLAIALYVDGNIYFSSDKRDVLDGMSRWFRLYSLLSALAAVLAFAQRQWTSLLLAGVLLMFNIYVGFRETAAVALLAIFLVHFHQQGPRRLLSDNRRAVVIALSAAAFFFVYKAIYKVVKQGEFAIVRARLAEPEFYLSTINDSEPFVTQCILNEVVRTNFETDGSYIFTGVAAQFMFFGNELGIEVTSFNDLFQPALFGDVEFGLAGNVWAEMLAAGGWPLLGCFVIAFVLTLRMMSRWLQTAHISTQACVALSATYFAFLIHRTDVGFQLTLQKRLFACWFIVVFASEMLHHASGRRRSPLTAPALRRALDEENPVFDPEAVHA